jgi:hypothetical protein
MRLKLNLETIYLDDCGGSQWEASIEAGPETDRWVHADDAYESAHIRSLTPAGVDDAADKYGWWPAWPQLNAPPLEPGEAIEDTWSASLGRPCVFARGEDKIYIVGPLVRALCNDCGLPRRVSARVCPHCDSHG